MATATSPISLAFVLSVFLLLCPLCSLTKGNQTAKYFLPRQPSDVFSQSIKAATFTSLHRGNETDRLALLDIKARITLDPHQVFTSWNDSALFCQWSGIACGHRHQRVTRINLPGLKLEGSLSPFIGNLSFLRELNIENNGFRGQIPPEIGRLFRLRYLGLENNSFGGQIPVNISRCTNLDFLRLGNNQLVGQVPAELGSLSKLRALYIYFNNLTGQIPDSFGNMSSLGILSASRNGFVGKIPETLGQLKRLVYLSCGGSKLSGMIPPSIYNLSSLIHLQLPANQLEGTLPWNLGFILPNLVVLNVAANRFTGPIPASISNATNLMRLTIPGNKFTGNVPSLENLHQLQWVSISLNLLGNGSENDLSFLRTLINATSLELLAINENNFGGTLPENFGNLSEKLNIMSLASNQISGGIPLGIGSLSNKLEFLDFGNNQFTGRIPDTIGNLQKLKELRFHGNKFSGNIPASIGNLTLLTKLDFERNNLEGSIPSSLGKCKNLLLLDFSHNNLYGSIPSEIFGISSLSIYLDLSRNQFTGSLPMEVGDLIQLTGFDVSDNKLSAEIPSSLGQCISLEGLIMGRNHFRGGIPSSLSALRSIEIFDISYNNLSGQIPKFLQNFPFLQSLNLSFNHLEGQVPTEGVFKNGTAVSLSGNDLCGGIPELHLPNCSIKESKQKGSKPLKLILPLVFGILALAILVTSFVFIWLRRKKKEAPALETPSLCPMLQLPYESILKAAGGFSADNLIGVGSFGSVYKGVLGENGLMVAVKVLNLQHHGASKSFMAECETLRCIRHRNLVKILTVCASADFQGNDFKALVYEYMVNGSLEAWLHPTPATEETSGASRNLDLQLRLNIAIDVACALNYLHYGGERPIAHCDLKPSNILLNEDLVGHVGDFGLARFLLQADGHSSHSKSTLGIRGSVGYIPPEYALGSKVSTDGDVYSFGVLLLEMFTGKRPTNEMFKDSMNLHNFVKSALPKRIMGIVDPLLLQEGLGKPGDNRPSDGRTERIEECLKQIFEIGIACSVEIMPSGRMKMNAVEAELRSIRDKLFGRGMHRERSTF